VTDNSAALHRHPAGFRLRRDLRVLETSPTTREGRLDLLAEYEAHLEHSPLASSTRVAYRRQTRGYLEWLARRPEGIGDALTYPHGRDFAVRDYRSSLKERRLGPASVNVALAAIDHLYRFLRLGLPSVRREALPAQAPRFALRRRARRASIPREDASLRASDAGGPRSCGRAIDYRSVRVLE
jgi:integrase/recombinase XerC